MERTGGPGKGRNLRQNRGGQNQGRRRGHSAAQNTRDTMQARTPPASTMTNKARALRTRHPRSGGAYVVHGRDNAWRSRAPGPHAHGNTARQVVDGLRTEVCGQQKQSNDPGNNQHSPQYANYWAPLTPKRHIPPHSAQPRHTNDWALRTRIQHQREHRPQRPSERIDPTQHAKGRRGDCPGPRKETTTRRNVTRGGFVREQVRGEIFVFQFGVEICPAKDVAQFAALPALWASSVFIRDDENAALAQYFTAIRQEGGPMDKESNFTGQSFTQLMSTRHRALGVSKFPMSDGLAPKFEGCRTQQNGCGRGCGGHR